MSEYDEWCYHNTIADIVDFMIQKGEEQVLQDISDLYNAIEDTLKPPVEISE